MKVISAMQQDGYSGYLQIQAALMLSQSAKIDKQRPNKGWHSHVHKGVGFHVFRSQSF